LRRVRITGETFAFNVAKERYGGEGRTLGSFLAETVNGVDLLLEDPYGGMHMVSLAPFAGEDPDRFLMFTFRTSREDDEFDPDYSDAVVLKEYELPPGAKIVE
jgi:hypothetical protein